MRYLTRREELLLLSIGNLKDKAYLVCIRERLSKIMGREWSISAIHTPLRRLEKEGLINSYYGESTAVRGGRRKKIYGITKMGMESLTESKKINEILWPDFPNFEIY